MARDGQFKGNPDGWWDDDDSPQPDKKKFWGDGDDWKYEDEIVGQVLWKGTIVIPAPKHHGVITNITITKDKPTPEWHGKPPYKKWKKDD